MSTDERMNNSGHEHRDGTPDEAARLAAAQAGRLAARASPATAAPQVEATVAPQVIGQLNLQLLANGQVRLSAPLDDPDRVLEMVRVLHVALIQHAREQGRQQAAAQRRVPFMQRVLGKRS